MLITLALMILQNLKIVFTETSIKELEKGIKIWKNYIYTTK